MSGKALVIFATLGAVLVSPAQNKPEASKKSPTAAASAPYIYLVDFDPISKQYNVHFETLANKRYTVQASRVMPAVATNWVDVLSVPPYPFANHYIYTEKYTNEVKRYFRLKMQ